MFKKIMCSHTSNHDEMARTSGHFLPVLRPTERKRKHQLTNILTLNLALLGSTLDGDLSPG